MYWHSDTGDGCGDQAPAPAPVHYNYTNQLRQAGLPGEDDIENGLQGIITGSVDTFVHLFRLWHLTHSIIDMAERWLEVES